MFKGIRFTDIPNLHRNVLKIWRERPAFILCHNVLLVQSLLLKAVLFKSDSRFKTCQVTSILNIILLPTCLSSLGSPASSHLFPCLQILVAPICDLLQHKLPCKIYKIMQWVFSTVYMVTKSEKYEVGARLCFYTCLWFCSQGWGAGVCLSAYWDTPPPQSKHPRSRHPPEQCTLGDTGNKRAVRILLECILVCFKIAWQDSKCTLFEVACARFVSRVIWEYRKYSKKVAMWNYVHKIANSLFMYLSEMYLNRNRPNLVFLCFSVIEFL